MKKSLILKIFTQVFGIFWKRTTLWILHVAYCLGKTRLCYLSFACGQNTLWMWALLGQSEHISITRVFWHSHEAQPKVLTNLCSFCIAPHQVRDVIMMPMFQPLAFSWATAAQYASENFIRVVWPHRRKLVSNSLCLEEWLSRDVSGLYGFRSLSRNVTPWNVRWPCILTTLTFRKQSRIFIKTQ